MAALDDLRHRHLMLDEALQNVVEHLVSRQRVLVGLIGFELGRRRLGDDALRHDAADRAEQPRQTPLIAPARQLEHRRLIDVFQHRIAAAHIAVKRRIARRHFRFIAGRK